MPSPEPRGIPPSPAPGGPWRVGGKVIAALGVAAFLFLTRLMLARSLGYISPEECHTGGIAREILRHGFQFPLVAYTPEVYENGIVVAGVLAVPFFALFGQNVLALKLLALGTSVVLALAGLGLLRRVMPQEAGDRARRVAAACAYLGLLGFGPILFTYKSNDSLGDHNEGTALSLLILLLLFRVVEAPRAGRRVLLWFVAGISAGWEMGTLLVSALALLHEVRAIVTRRSRARWLVADAMAFVAGYSPGLAAGAANRFMQFRVVAVKFMSEGQGASISLAGWAQRAWLYLDWNPALALCMGAALLWLAGMAVRRRLAPEPMVYLGLYAGAQQVLLAMAPDQGAYPHYSYPALALPVARWAGLAVGGWWHNRTDIRRLAAAAAAVGVAVLIVTPQWAPDLGRPLRLLQDRDRAACSWRFGRAFLNRTDQHPQEAMDLCRRLEGPASLECISGVGFVLAATHPSPMGRDRTEQRAFAWGVGTGLASGSGDLDNCDALADTEMRQLCHSGGVAECLEYVDLVTGSRLPAPACVLHPPPFGGMSSAWFAELKTRPPRSDVAPLPYAEDGACQSVLRQCYPQQDIELRDLSHRFGS
jgi:hypothetical protein